GNTTKKDFTSSLNRAMATDYDEDDIEELFVEKFIRSVVTKYDLDAKYMIKH
ncbi:hypothetical protein Tco_0614833, partial [Tanacetum coccineum]